MSAAAVAFSSIASTTLRRLPDPMAATAVATARSHCGVVRLPSAQRTPVGMTGGAGRAGRPGPRRGRSRALAVVPIVVSQPAPSARPSTTRGTTSTEPSEVGSKVKLPNATGPVPGSADIVGDVGAVEQLAQPLLAGHEPVVPGRAG